MYTPSMRVETMAESSRGIMGGRKVEEGGGVNSSVGTALESRQR
jgi:hypothetical protein